MNMNASFKFAVLCILLCLFNETSSQQDNELEGEQPNFRLLKYQEVWELVSKRLTNINKRNELSRILKKLDKTELEFKRKKERGDPTYHPEEEQIILDMLPELMKRFGVLEEFDNWKPKENHFDDVRLQEWWTKVVVEGEFDGKELKDLHAEFHALQKRLNKYVWLVRKIAEVEKQNSSIGKTEEKDAGNLDDDKTGDKDLASLKKRLNLEFGKIDEEMMHFIEKIKGRISATRQKENHFTDKRVAEMLKKAKGLLIEKDFVDFKVDVDAFQNKIWKLKHWEKISNNLRSQLEETGFEKGLQQEYQFAKDKVKELKRVVKKYHFTLSDRLLNYYHKSEL